MRSPQPGREASPEPDHAGALMSGFQPLVCEKQTSVVDNKLPRLWSAVTAAWTEKDRHVLPQCTCEFGFSLPAWLLGESLGPLEPKFPNS